MQLGFSHKKYLEEQSKYILERVRDWDKLYLEFGGKLMFDLHAKRCLPGYQENAKLELLSTLREQAEIIICVYAGDIERNKTRGDSGISYDADVFRLIDDLRSYDLNVNSVVITRYNNQPAAQLFAGKLEGRGIHTYTHHAISGYPSDMEAIVSDHGYGSNPFIETTKPIVVVTAPGPGSGKLATCLGQLYHEHQRGHRAGYAKFETFPVWNLPLSHPLNIAYEASTADLKDFNMIDSFYLEATGNSAVNYNRDMEVFPIIKRIIQRITGGDVYHSPTDMGVNCIKAGIIDDCIVQEASHQEIIRRYLRATCDYKLGAIDADTLHRHKMLLDSQELLVEDRAVVLPARKYLEITQNRLGQVDGISVTALQLPDGRIITGRNSTLMSAPAAALLNAVKTLGNIPDAMHLLPPIVIEPILDMKTTVLKMKNCILNSEEILMALSVSAVTNPAAATAVKLLSSLDGCQAHSTTFTAKADQKIYHKLGLELTSDPQYLSDSLFYT